jgi:enoyl-CoA hydratase
LTMTTGRWRLSLHATSDGVRVITLNRPDQRNALSPELYREIKEGILEGWADPEVRIVMLRGTAGSFACGGDLKHFLQLLDAPPAEQLWRIARSYEEPLPFRTMLDCPKPIVSVVDGVCVAGGLVMVACSDYVIATTRSVFAVPEGNVGLADPFCPALLPRIVGDIRARAMMLTGRRVSAAVAEQWGLINESVETSDLDDAVDAARRDLLRSAPASIAAYKRATNLQIPHMSTTMISESAQSQSGREGLQAFVEKRAPHWG